MHIGVLEDDVDQANLISHWLAGKDHTTTCFEKGQDLITAVRSQRFDMLVLDWELPDIDGLSVLKWLRRHLDREMPIVFMTARDDEKDIVAALSAGADEYLTKPLSQPEAIARIEAVARRSNIAPDSKSASQVIGPIEFNLASQQILLDSKPVSLTRREFELVVMLLQNLGRLVPRDVILKEIWGLNANVVTRTVDTHISRVRKKLNLTPEAGWLLKGVYHHGYRLERLED